MSKKIIVARVMDRYEGPSNYYLNDRMRMMPTSRYETICIYLRRNSDSVNNLEEFFRCFYLGDAKIGGMNLPTIWKLAKVLKAEKVDIIHACRHAATIYGALGGALAGTPVMMGHVHGMNRCRNFRRRLLYRVLAPKITRMIGCADGVRDDIAKNYPGIGQKAVSLPNSIDYAKYHDVASDRDSKRQELGIPQDAFVFTNVGRLSPVKGHDLLLDAFAQVALSDNGYLLIVGDGRLKAQIRKQAEDLGISDRVILTGRRTDVPEILKACDAFALSSTSEGMPLCVFEAMAAGLPVIATGKGGTKELMDGGDLGIYLDERSVDAFANGMRQVLALSPEERKSVVEKADRKVKSVYNHKHAVKILQSIYEDALAEKGVR